MSRRTGKQGKIVVIPDLHGSPRWKDIVNKEAPFNLIIFLGDYVDSFDHSSPDQLANLKDVLTFKSDNLEKVILLLGNHDIHYLPWIEKPYSGYQVRMASEFRELYLDAIEKKHVQMCYQNDHLLFTHAGVTKTWCNHFDINQSHPTDKINDLLYHKPEALGFIKGNGYPDPYGDDIYQSPTWVRPGSLISDGISGFWQIVGHTVQKEIMIIEKGNERYFFCDTLLHNRQYLIFQEGSYSFQVI